MREARKPAPPALVAKLAITKVRTSALVAVLASAEVRTSALVADLALAETCPRALSGAGGRTGYGRGSIVTRTSSRGAG